MASLLQPWLPSSQHSGLQIRWREDFTNVRGEKNMFLFLLPFGSQSLGSLPYKHLQVCKKQVAVFVQR